MPLLKYTQTPVHEIDHPVVTAAGLRLIVKREDLNHDSVSGNKWWKLKYNLIAAAKGGFNTVLTFGGAFSNHIYSTAAAALELKMNAIGIIRGERYTPLNDTLQFAEDCGMKVHHVSREQYKEKTNEVFIEQLREQFGSFYLIPEGGTNNLAIQGCAEFAETILSNIEADYICLPVGTGGTMAGLICGMGGNEKIIGVAVLKNGHFLEDEIANHVKNFAGTSFSNWSLQTEYHHGGYAKITPELLSFISDMNASNQIPLDPVYTGKLLWAIMQEIKKGAFERGSTILMIHTGGLQGSPGTSSRKLRSDA